jgi:hypothetical protein
MAERNAHERGKKKGDLKKRNGTTNHVPLQKSRSSGAEPQRESKPSERTTQNRTVAQAQEPKNVNQPQRCRNSGVDYGVRCR